MSLPLLENGPRIVDAEQVDEFAKLREEIQELRAEIDDLEARYAKDRQQIIGWAHAMRAIFGGNAETVSQQTTPENPKVSRVWESWKQKLPGKPAEIIQALLEHGEMNVAQIRVAAHCGQQTVYDVTSKLYKLGLINKNGGKYSLKAL